MGNMGDFSAVRGRSSGHVIVRRRCGRITNRTDENHVDLNLLAIEYRVRG